MEKLLQEDLWFIVYSVAYGGAIGLFYDILRMLRIAIKSGTVITFVQDIIFWAFTAIATFIYIFAFAGGTVRIIFLLFVAVGWVMYYISLGKLLVWIFSSISKPIKLLLCKIRCLILKPFRPLIVKVYEKQKTYKKKFKKKIKNSNFLFHFSKKNNKIYKDKYSYALKRRR